jgi:hypothetical protein
MDSHRSRGALHKKSCLRAIGRVESAGRGAGGALGRSFVRGRGQSFLRDRFGTVSRCVRRHRTLDSREGRSARAIRAAGVLTPTNRSSMNFQRQRDNLGCALISTQSVVDEVSDNDTAGSELRDALDATCAVRSSLSLRCAQRRAANAHGERSKHVSGCVVRAILSAVARPVCSNGVPIAPSSARCAYARASVTQPRARSTSARL